MATRKKKNNIGAFGHPIYGKGFAKYGEMRPNGSSETPNDLEEAADNYIGEVVDAAGHPGWEWETRDVKDALIAGYNLCREQMMKEAVEYEVGMHGEPIKITLDKYVQRARGIFPGDKVRVIVLPKND